MSKCPFVLPFISTWGVEMGQGKMGQGKMGLDISTHDQDLCF
jgi:hypothetical protein